MAGGARKRLTIPARPGYTPITFSPSRPLNLSCFPFATHPAESHRRQARAWAQPVPAQSGLGVKAKKRLLI